MMKKWGKALREKEMQIAIEQRKNPETVRFQGFLVRVVIQNFLKKPVISTVFKADK